MKFTKANFEALIASIDEAKIKLLEHHDVKPETESADAAKPDASKKDEPKKELQKVRKNEDTFLKTVVDAVAKLEAKDGNYERHFNIILGALLVLKQDIEVNRKFYEGSYYNILIKDIIEEHMFPKPSTVAPPAAKQYSVALKAPVSKAAAAAKATAAAVAKPTAATSAAAKPELTPNQSYVAHYSLNDFLQMLIYKEGNPAKGYDAANPFIKNGLALKTLKTFMTMSYDLQTAAHSNKKYDKNGKETNGNDLRLFTDISKITLKFDDLMSPFKKMIRTATVKSTTAKISDLAAPRSFQLGFLQEIAQRLQSDLPWKDAANDKHRAAIFAGALLLVREHIYSKKPIFNRDAKCGSKAHKAISEMLDVTKLTDEQVRVYMTSTQHYLVQMCYERIGADNALTKESVRAKHLFSGIKDFALEPFMHLLEQVINYCRAETLNDEVKRLQQETGTTKTKSVIGTVAGKVGGFFGFSSSSKKPPVVAATKDDETTADADAGADAGAAAATATPAPAPTLKVVAGSAAKAAAATTAKPAAGSAAAAVKASTAKAAFLAPKPNAETGSKAKPVAGTSNITVTDADEDDFDGELSYYGPAAKS